MSEGDEGLLLSFTKVIELFGDVHCLGLLTFWRVVLVSCSFVLEVVSDLDFVCAFGGIWMCVSSLIRERRASVLLFLRSSRGVEAEADFALSDGFLPSLKGRISGERGGNNRKWFVFESILSSK